MTSQRVAVRCDGKRRNLLGGAAAALALLAAAPALGQGKSILVIAAHPDDEVLMAAGRSRLAFTSGDQIKVVVVTNGDQGGVAAGLAREGQSVTSAGVLGLPEQDVVFMGYPDGSLKTIHDNPSSTAVVTSAAGQTATYGNRGMGGMPYHQLLWGVPGPYSKATVRSDFQNLISEFQPDEIYTHSDFEDHPDHEAVALFVAEALGALQRSGMSLHTKLYQTIVWMPGSGYPWPELDPTAWSPGAPYLPDSAPCTPGACLDQTVVEWDRAFHFAQPPEMLDPSVATNMKAVALAPLNTLWFDSFVRKDEFFWLNDYGLNLATTATVTASSEDAAGGLYAINAVDGIVKGYPLDQGYEWASNGQLAGAWIQLTWPAPVRIGQVNLWDRPSTDENVQAGTLLFSDGSQVSVGALPPAGQVMPVLFAPKTVTWVRFRVDQAVGNEAGLAEIQVFGALASATANVPPNVVQGPWPAARSLPANQSTTVSVVANDVDGDALTYQWSAEAGSIVGAGPTATYTPPPVSAATWFTIGVTVTDAHGGSTSNLTYVQVTPAPASTIAVSPAAVFGGNPATGTIVLGSPAPAGGKVVPLTSSQPALASVPASVTVPAGTTTATFTVTTHAVTASTPVSITASFGTTSPAASLTLAPVSAGTLALAPANVLGGLPSQATLTLPAAAGPGGLTVQLASSDPATAAVPTSVAVPAGATSATFAVATAAVAAARTVTLSATYGTTTTATLTVSPLGITGLTLTPTPVVGGNAVSATVSLNGPAPSGGVAIGLSSTAPAVAPVPATVTVPAGATSATFAVTTSTVAASATLTLGATYAASSASASLTVTPIAPNPNLISNPEQIGGAGWDVWGNLTVTLNYAAAPDGSAHASRGVSPGTGHALRYLALGLTPNTVYTFSFFARNHGGTAASYSVYDDNHGQDIVSATPYLSRLGAVGYTRVAVTFTTPAGCTGVGLYPLRDSGGPVDLLLWGAKLEVGANATGYQNLGAETLSVIPASVAGGATAQGILTLASPAPQAGLVVALSAGPGASVPSSVAVVPGGTGAAFTISTSTVGSSTPVTITAQLPGGPQTATLTLTLPSVATVALAPAAVVGGTPVQGTVTLNDPAPAGGAAVALSSSAPATASVPGSVVVPAGATSATFVVATSGATSTSTVSITATYGTSVSATLTVGPLVVSGLTLDPASVVGGSTSQGTVTLNGAAPAGGAAVALTSSAPGTASVPATVTVPAGALTASFIAGTASVASSATVTLGAAYGGASVSAPLTVTAFVPPPPNPNLLVSPTQVGGPGWDVWGSLTATLTAAAAPDGSSHSTLAVSSGGGHALRQLVLGLTANTTYTLSFYAQNNGGTAASYSVYDDDHGQDIVPATPYVSQLSGAGFTRVIVTFTTPPGCRAVGIYPLRDSGGPVDVLLWGAKLEVGAVATTL